MTRGNIPCVICNRDGHSSSSCKSELAEALRQSASREHLEAVYLAAMGVLKEWARGGDPFCPEFGELARALEQTNEAAYHDFFKMGARETSGLPH